MTGIEPPARCKTCIRFLTFILFQVITCFYPLYAQSGHYEKVYTVENGLPHNQVLSITSDKTGFLWIGTWDGLSRFDGYEFRNYHHDPNDSTTIPYFICYKIRVDRYNNVWIYHVGSMLSMYQRNTDNFRNYSFNADKVLAITGIGDIETDKEGNLYAIGPNGIALYDSAISGFRRLKITNWQERPLKEIYWNLISFDQTGNIWLSSNDTIYKAEGLTEKLTIRITDSFRFILDSSIYPKANNSFHQINVLELADNSAWLVSNRGLRNIASGDFFQDLPSEIPDISGFKWFHGGDKINVRTERDDYEIKLNPDESPQTLYVDRSGTVWYSTTYISGMSTGLHRYNKTPSYFRHYLPEVNGMPSVVHSIAKDNNGNILVGADGINYIICITKEGVFRRLNIFSKEEALNYQHLRCLLTCNEGIYAGYMKGRLDYYDYSTAKFKNISITDDLAVNEPYGFRSLHIDKPGNLLIGSMGIFMMNPDKPSEFHKIWQSNPRVNGIFSLTSDASGTIWAGSGGELFKISADYRVDTIYKISNTVYNIEDISFDQDQNIWMALLGGGILKFNPSTGTKKYFTTADGLSNNTTYSILQDSQRNLWITTDNGISRFNPVTEKFRIFGPTDGLMIHEFNSDASFLDNEGRMFFGGMGGVVSFHPDSIFDLDDADDPKSLVITDFRVSGVPRHFEVPIYETGKVFLKKGDDNFGVTFACMDLKNAEKIKYRYRISGYNEEWTETDHLHRTINITGLEPSTYTLEIQSSDIFGEWTKDLNLQIQIPPMFHQTRAFFIIVLLLAATIIGMFLLLNNRQIRIKESQKQQYLKLESIRGQMNPHFIFNSLNSINYFIANNDRLAANRYIANFSKLIRSFLSNMSQEYIGLQDEIASLEDYLKLEYLRFSDKFEYDISVKDLTTPDKWEVFPGMVQPFVENAIWHGVRGLQERKGTIRIVFNENSGIHCTITDDGVGRQLSAKTKYYHEKKKSKGIGLIMERIQLINHLENKNYKIKIEDLYCDREESGTRIEIEIPSRIRTHI